MKTVIFAYRKVGYECVEHLLKIGEPPSLVVTPEEGNNKINIYKNITDLCEDRNVDIHHVDKINDDIELIKKIYAIKPDIYFSCYFPFVIPSLMLEIPKLGGLNLHGGILPNYRGTLSGVWSIINDEKKTGVTLHYMESRVDVGDIVEIRECNIDDEDTGFSLYEKTSSKSVELFQEYYSIFSKGKRIKRIAQSYEEGFYYKREIPYLGVIDWNWSARKIFNFCRALYFPTLKGAVCIISKNEIEILETAVTSIKSKNRAGVFFELNEKIYVSSSTYDIEIIKAKCNGVPIKLKDLIKLAS